MLNLAFFLVFVVRKYVVNYRHNIIPIPKSSQFGGQLFTTSFWNEKYSTIQNMYKMEELFNHYIPYLQFDCNFAMGTLSLKGITKQSGRRRGEGSVTGFL